MVKNRKDFNDFIRKAAKAGNTAELAHSEMNDLIKGKKTLDEIMEARPKPDRELTTDDMVAITEYMAKSKVSWAKAREAYLAIKVEAEKVHPMSQAIRRIAGRTTKTEKGE